MKKILKESYKVKVTPHGQGSFYQGGFSSYESAKNWADSYKDKGPYSFVKCEIMKENKKLNKVKNMTLKESIYKQIDSGVKNYLSKLTEDLTSEVDNETWNEPEVVDNSEIISVDDVEEDEEPESAEEFIMKAQGLEPQKIETGKPSILSEYDDLSNDEKKELLLQLAKNDNNLSSIIANYMNKKIDEESSEEEKKYSTWATEQGSGNANADDDDDE